MNLIYANVNYEDILLKKELDELADKYPSRFRVFYVLNNPPTGWDRRRGLRVKGADCNSSSRQRRQYKDTPLWCVHLHAWISAPYDHVHRPSPHDDCYEVRLNLIFTSGLTLGTRKHLDELKYPAPAQ